MTSLLLCLLKLFLLDWLRRYHDLDYYVHPRCQSDRILELQITHPWVSLLSCEHPFSPWKAIYLLARSRQHASTLGRASCRGEAKLHPLARSLQSLQHHILEGP